MINRPLNNNMSRLSKILTGFALLVALPAVAQNCPDNWWPVQKAPRSIVTCKLADGKDAAGMNLAQSLSGLAARAVNDGRSSEGIWIDYANPNYAGYFRALLQRTGAKKSGVADVWKLLARLQQRKIVDGYVLYDLSANDNSINVATVYAGIYDAVLIDRKQEPKAISMGLRKLADACGTAPTTGWFDSVSNQLNRQLLVLVNPAIGNNRDYAIAHRAMVYYGVDSLLEHVLAWMKPLSPVVGWNKGDEFHHIAPCSRWGMINTVSDFCMNLPMLSIRTNEPLPKIKHISPDAINWSATGQFRSFVLSDGDNMQWTSNQFLSSTDYWKNPARDKIPMSFTTCVSNLSMVSPDVYATFVNEQPPFISLVEYGGGYLYPDLFGRSRPHPDSVLRAYARILNRRMERIGASVLGIICRNLASAETKEACSIFAEEINGLTGIIAVQYSPYNGGDGKITWYKNREGISIPVVAAKYQLWANQKRKGSGGPADIAQLMNRDTAGVSFNWTIVHAWSRFEKTAEDSIRDIPKGDKNGERGVTPVAWTAARLQPANVVIPIEELLWRIRMNYSETETKKAIAALTRATGAQTASQSINLTH